MNSPDFASLDRWDPIETALDGLHEVREAIEDHVHEAGGMFVPGLSIVIPAPPPP